MAYTNIFVSLVNLFSLLLGGLSIGLLFKYTRYGRAEYLNYYFLFLVFAVISGFCDWIIFNWIRMLVPDISRLTVDLIYHIFWDLIGFPTAIFALFFLVLAINKMIGIDLNRTIKRIVFSILIIFTIISITGLYFRLSGGYNLAGTIAFTTFFYILPILQLCYLFFAFFRSDNPAIKNSPVRKLILLLFFGQAIWYFLSFTPMATRALRHMIIFSYYLSIFLPSIYLYFYLKNELKMKKKAVAGSAEMDLIPQSLNFTPREKELVTLLMQGKSNKEISEELFISLQTVKNYISKIFKRYDLKNRLELVNFIRQHQE